MYEFLIIIHIIVSIFLVLIVLLQTGRGGEMGAAFGGIGQAQTVRTPGSFVGKLTTALAILFMLLSFSLAFFSTQQSQSSVLDRVDAQEIQTTPLPDAQVDPKADAESTAPSTQ